MHKRKQKNHFQETKQSTKQDFLNMRTITQKNLNNYDKFVKGFSAKSRECS